MRTRIDERPEYDMTRTHRARAQELGELRWVVDGSGTSRRPCLVVTAQKTCRLHVRPKPHREICNNDGTNVRRARAMGAGGLLVTWSRLRAAMVPAQISDRVRGHITDKQQHGKSCEETQKSFAMQALHWWPNR